MILSIKRGTSKLRDAALNVFAGRILDKMTANANFPTPTPTLTELTKAVDDYAASLEKAKSRDLDLIIAKNVRKSELKFTLNQLFDYVNLTGGKDIEILTSSGFPLTKERQPVGVMPKPEGIKVTLGDGAGEVHVSCKKVHGADVYVYQYLIAPSPEVENWITVNDPRSRITLTKLEPGTQYKFRVSAVGSKGQGPWSDAITRYVA